MSEHQEETTELPDGREERERQDAERQRDHEERQRRLGQGVPEQEVTPNPDLETREE